ncbi:MAG: 2,3-bisphosphoglycerate-independent phosphoglycerate mutase [Candidatus Lokiarchaeota archaeon]|nr:2,3-bisphosphoglycerate-independent phosphoglycerate mutase [Candidatus Lokiarchaeota archaeon]
MRDWDYYYKNYTRESNYKVIFLILDGMPDIFIKELGGTPLAVANTPNLDNLAKKGANGLIYTAIEPFIPIGSGPAHLALFGYELEKYPGRGALEALGSEIEVPQGSVIIRMNFATIDKNKRILDRRAGRISGKDSENLFKRLNNLKTEKFWCLNYKVYHTKGYRGVLVISGENASAGITDSDPREVGRYILRVEPTNQNKTSRITANFLNWFINEAQKELSENNITKANAIVTRGAGFLGLKESLKDRYKFKSPIFVSSFPLYKGVARFLRIPVKVPDISDTNKKLSIKDKFITASKLIKDHDLTILHVKEPDIAGEDGDFIRKKEIIEEIDKNLIHILKNMNENDTIVITSDHSTPCYMKEHSGHPIPILITGPFVRVDKVQKFSEISCIHGSLGSFKAIQLMNLILMSTKRLITFGA